ncbi:helix-turn-helix transcriptional regulator [Salinibacter sp.]|jgi:predicted DNA-binding transcriptional regulator YafY|uniref:helix-turn-helix transcriptional regulator n=1 Tax=Salinibacter sp. TaxID=2065818 RepID=UPI0021E6DA31|nr:WYL domain-containing protein [Salinibacter sp.]
MSIDLTSGDASPKKQLSRFLNAGREATLDELSSHLGVTRRHVRRLLRELEEEGRPIQERWEEGTKRFSLAPEARSIPAGRVDLKESELQALTVAASAAQATLHPTPFDNQLREAVRKLLQAAGTTFSFEPEWQPEIWHFDTGASSNVNPEVFWAVVRAANRLETLSVDYHSASTGRLSERRSIDPLVIAEQAGSWLVAAYCHESQEVLDFSLPGIRAAEPTGEYFARPEGFDSEGHFEDRFYALRGEGHHEVVLKVEEEKAAYFRRKTYHPSQQVEDREEGGITVTFETSSLDDVAAFIRSWGPGVRVLAPDKLAERIAAEARQVADAYR